MTRACSSVDRVPGYEPVGRRFESRQARQHDTLRLAVRVCFYVYIYTSLRKETDHAEF